MSTLGQAILIKRIPQILGLLVLFVLSDSTSAQLFGPRRVGRNVRGNPAPSTSSVGTVTEDRRFVRGNRSANDFVGTDSTEARAFVGSTQATNDGNVTTAVESLREQPNVRVNRPATISRRGIYRPRLQIAFSVQPAEQPESLPQDHQAPFETLSGSVRELSREHSFRITHDPRERSATLTGTVPTEHDRQIAELLVLFEPGVETVENDLRVAN